MAVDHTTTKNLGSSRLWHKFAGAILDDKTRKLLDYRHLIKHPKYKETCCHSYGNKIERLAQRSTNTVFISHTKEVPQQQQKDITYRYIMCDCREGKAKPNQTRLMGGQNKLLQHSCNRPTLLNSIISTLRVQSIAIDIKTFTSTSHSNDMNTSNSNWTTYQWMSKNSKSWVKRWWKMDGYMWISRKECVACHTIVSALLEEG